MTVSKLAFPPSKYVRWFADAAQEYRDNAADCLAALNDGEFNRAAYDRRDDAWNEASNLFDCQVDKIIEEHNEVLAEADLEKVEENEASALSLMGECADLVQATLQLMYMVGSLHGIPTNEVLGMTKLKCLGRDREFYDLTRGEKD